jgi:ABC-type transport system substrate-binding protein
VGESLGKGGNARGTGPFQFVSYQKDVAIRYRDFPDYWGGRPAIDNLVFAIMPSATVRTNQLKVGECHVIAYPNLDDLAKLKADPGLAVVEKPGVNVSYVLLHTRRKPFDDPRVMPDAKRAAEMIQADLRAVGIRAHLFTEEWKTYLRRDHDGAYYHAAIVGWSGDNGDPDNFLALALSCDGDIPHPDNLARWCNPEFGDLITAVKIVSAQEVRADLYRRAQEVFHRDLPWIPLAHSFVYAAYRRDVKGFRMDSLGHYVFNDAALAG